MPQPPPTRRRCRCSLAMISPMLTILAIAWQVAACADDKPEGGTWKVAIEFFHRPEVGRSVITVDGSGKLGFSSRVGARAIQLDKPEAERLRDLAIKAHKQLRRPKGNDAWNDATFVKLDIDRPGETPRRFSDGHFLYRDEIPAELRELVDACNRHVEKFLQLDIDQYLHIRAPRAPPRRTADSTITFRYGAGTPGDSKPFGHYTATIRGDGHIRITALRLWLADNQNVVLYDDIASPETA